MTNKDEEGEPSKDCNPRFAALLAVHLVSQVLDEAYVIANAAQDSGQPWRYVSMLKNFKNNDLGFADDEDESFETSKGDSANENNIDVVANIVTTSTPQKCATRQIDCSDEVLTFNDSTLIGQGDEEIETQHDLENSTSMFINHLFDMSDVERIILCDDSEIQSNSEPNDLLAEAMDKIMDSYVTNAFQPIEDLPAVMSSYIANNIPSIEDIQACIEQNVDDDIEEPVTVLSKSDHSEYSLLADAIVADIGRDVAFYIDEEAPIVNDEVYERLQCATVQEITEDIEDKKKEAIKLKNDFELYEKAYMTLNRDYDQCSEDDGYPILQDPKEMILQEVELMTANTSNEELQYSKASGSKPIEEEATVSGTSGPRKSTLVRKCRYQGAKLFSCLRGWWQRKMPGKRKESRMSGLAVCPLTPDVRRRTSSLLDHRLLRSPSPSAPVSWKFNTVNEALVNSNCWKDYTFDAMAEGSGDL